MKYPTFFIAFFITIIRYYDYSLFGFSAAILAKNFIISTTDNQKILIFFAIFSLSVIARPIGSIIFGIIGDKYGRTVTIKISVILASTSTSLIAITPTVNQIGIFATIILTLCRMLFLVSLAGEIDSIKIYVAEKIGATNKNLANGIISCCSQIGALLAAIAYYYSIKSEYSEYLWRVNFIIGGILGLIIIIIRNYLQESEEFLHYKTSNNNLKQNDLSIWQLIKNTKDCFAIALLINGCIGAIYHFLVIFLGTFFSKILFIINPNQGQTINIILIIIYTIMSLYSGFLADKINPKKQIFISLILSLIILTIMQYLPQKPIFLLYIPAILIGFAPFYVIPLQIILQSLFAVNIRVRMYSLSHALGSMIFSSTTPFLCMLLWQHTHSLQLIFGFVILLLIILLGSITYLYSKILKS